jgi:hypothetical protein
MKNLSLGTVGNSLAGILGGGLGGQVLGLLGLAQASGGGMDIGSIVSSIVGGGVGGGVLMVIIGVIKKAMAKWSSDEGSRPMIFTEEPSSWVKHIQVFFSVKGSFLNQAGEKNETWRKWEMIDRVAYSIGKRVSLTNEFDD